MKPAKCPFQQFQSYFPELELPLTLHTEAHHHFTAHNQALTESCIHRWIEDIEPTEPNPYLEFVPCLRITGVENCHALVYWKADLLQYEYILTTFSLKEELVARKSIAGFKANQDKTIIRIATIEEDGIIGVAQGESSLHQSPLELENQRNFHFEILDGGDILQAYDRSIY